MNDAVMLLLSRLTSASLAGGLLLVLAVMAARSLSALSARNRVWLLRLAQVKLMVSLVPLPALVVAWSTAAPKPGGSGEGVGEWWPLPLAACWLAGALWQLSRQVAAGGAALRLEAGSSTVTHPEIGGMYREVAAEMRVEALPALRAHAEVGAPLLVALPHATILLPADAVPDGRLRCALAHELAHVRHADLPWGWLSAVCRVVFFFHPLVWLAEDELRHWQEAAADQAALQTLCCSPGSYAEALLDYLARPIRSATPVAGLSAVSTLSRMERRLRTLYFRPDCSPAASVATGGLLIATTAALVPVSLRAAPVPLVSKGRVRAVIPMRARKTASPRRTQGADARAGTASTVRTEIRWEEVWVTSPNGGKPIAMRRIITGAPVRESAARPFRPSYPRAYPELRDRRVEDSTLRALPPPAVAVPLAPRGLWTPGTGVAVPAAIDGVREVR